jgi:PAS domain S-box-containing protein
MTRAPGIVRLRLSTAGDVLEVRPTGAMSSEREAGKAGGAAAAGPVLDRLKEWVRWPEAARGPAALEQAWGEGGRRLARMLVAPVAGADGGVAHFDVFVSDASAGEEAKAGADRLFLESILEALPSPVFVKDERHCWVLLNDSVCRLMGAERGDLLGKSDYDFFPKAEADVFWAKDDAVFATGVLNENEEAFTDAAGRAHVILTRKTLHVDPAGNRFLVGVITDITERKQMEDELRRSHDELDRRVAERTAELERLNRQLQEEDRRKTEFLAILGHELRNPLTPIRNAVYALQRQYPEGSPQDRPRAIIERQVAQMARLIDDLLDVSRIARGKILLQESRFDLVHLVRGAAEDRAEVLEAHGLALETRLPDRPVPMVGDPARIAQAVGNLLDNAQKFTDPGGRIEVAVELDEAARTAEISVRDSGIGMPPGMPAQLFEPFAQPEASLRRGGLGLGLALVKGLAELHRGAVAAASPGPGLGSVFTIRLPLVAAAPAESGAPAPPRTPGRHRILVVEDNEDAADSLRLVLEMFGHEVAVARNGAEGVEIAARFRPGVVLSDIGLDGGMSGYDVARALRASPELRRTRLVAVTGYGQGDDRRRALEAGFDEHIVKPFDVDALCRLIDRLAAPVSGAPAGD